MAMLSVNPATGEEMARFEEFGDREVEERVQKAREAFKVWRKTPVDKRAAYLQATAGYLRQNKGELARLMTLEMGKPIAQAEAEVEKCAWACEYFAEKGAEFLSPIPKEGTGHQAYVAFRPLGPVLAIMPWNFPFWQVFRFAAPALMAGNVGLLKHASNVPQCSLAIEKIFREVGYPDGVFQSLLISGKKASELIGHPAIAAATLTGSGGAGEKVGEAAGRALKKVVLELGGSDPFIVLADADLKEAARVGAWARNQNNGQSCIAAKRFIVEEKVADEFLHHFQREVAALKVGDPLDPETQIGPLARGDLRDTLEDQVERSVKEGAQLLLGGRREGPGFYYDPGILTRVTPSMPAGCEELFGPVAAVLIAKDEEEAIRLANDTSYGLGASLWTRDLEKAERLAGDIEAGSVFINGMVASDPRLPFGGVKASGHGRELSEFGIREFVNIQTVWIGPEKK
ncbi:MAG: NAD-dependent succinate-semialdehyde dehydrogenase [Clostridiales bacterium]|nr:NAD-dependent succinate-semialdehyde dehydrogenase [Clostridiales bacterium]